MSLSHYDAYRPTNKQFEVEEDVKPSTFADKCRNMRVPWDRSLLLSEIKR